MFWGSWEKRRWRSWRGRISSRCRWLFLSLFASLRDFAEDVHGISTRRMSESHAAIHQGRQRKGRPRAFDGPHVVFEGFGFVSIENAERGLGQDEGGTGHKVVEVS